jgi:large subunit ribosomal protein L18
MKVSSKRERKHKRVRSRILGSTERPRLSVFRSNRFVYAQIIDDEKGKTLLSVNTRKENSGSPIDQARSAGKKLGKVAKEKGIKKVAFDRGGYLYTGKIKSFAEGAREGGLDF